MKFVTQILLILFSFCQFLSASSVDKNNAAPKNSSFEKYLFYIENNEVDKDAVNSEIIRNNLEKDLIGAIVNYKQNKFEDSYRLLFTHLKEKPKILKYYEYLVKTAGVLNKYSQLKNFVSQREDETEFLYLSGLIDYYETNYRSAEEKFTKVLQTKLNSVEVLIYLSNTQRRLGDYKAATKTLQDAEKVISKTDPKTAEILVLRGSLYFLSDKYEEAEKAYKEGMHSAKESNNNIEIVKANLNLGMINDLNGNIAKARELFNSAYHLANKIYQKELAALVLSEWAVSFTYSNEPVEARKRYEKSYSIFQTFNNRERMALTAINIASLYLNIGNYRGALDYYNSALEKSGENVRAKMLSLRGLGDVYTNLANYTKALKYYDDAKELSKKIKDISNEAEINIGMGILFYNLGKPQKALELILENFDDINENELPYLKAELDQKAGIIYTSTGDYSKAEKFLAASIKLSDKFEDIYNSILSNTYLAYSYILNNNAKSGKKILRKQLKLCKEYGLNQLAGMQLLMISETSNGSWKYNDLKEAVKFSLSAGDKSTLAEIYFDIGKYHEKQEELGSAEEYFLKAISIVENQLPLLKNSSEMQITFFANYHQMYVSLTDLYLRTGNIQKAFRTLDRSRSRNTLYNLIGIKFSETNDIDLVNEFYDVNWKLQNNLGDADSLELRLQKIRNELANKFPELTNQLNIKSSAAGFLQPDIFSSNEYFISYFFNSDSIYVFKTSRKGLELIKLQTSVSNVEDIVSSISPYYNIKVIDKDIHFNKDLFSFNPDKAHELYMKILEPILNEIPENSELVFSLPNQLAALPFEFLTIDKRSTTSESSLFDRKYLIEYYSITYSPSFSIWKELKSRPNSKNKLALLAGDPDFNTGGNGYSSSRGVSEKLDLYSRDIKVLPLKYSLEEIEDIEGYFSNDVVLLKDKATETNFKKNAQSASVIHLSTHSFLYNNYPVVIFAEDDENDGYLETGEVAKLKLNSDMVVLSSCKSGLGNIDKAEGILGMQKVFFDAGASSVVLSLWDVSDKYTVSLMKYFYEFLSDGQTKSEALRNAKVKFVNEIDPNPYYWAAFTLSGNSNPIQFVNDSNIYIYLFGLIILMLLSYLYIKKKYLVRHNDFRSR